MNKNKQIYAQQLKKLYNQSFPEDWIEKYEWSEENEAKKSFIQCKNIISKFSEDYLYIISLSVLSGEYVQKSDSINSIIKYLLDSTTKEYGDPEDNANSPLKRNILIEFEKIGQNIKSSCLAYRSVIRYYPEHYDKNHKLRFRVYEAERRSKDNKITNFEDVVLPLCKSDMYFQYDDQLIDDLLMLKNIIKELISKETNDKLKIVWDLCNEKANFLLKKLLSYSGPIGYSINFEDYQVTLNSINLTYSKELWEQFELFTKEDNITKENPLILKYQQNVYSGYSKFSEEVLLLRIYSLDKNKSEIPIINLINQFEGKYNCLYDKSIKRAFDKNALNSIKNVMYNCHLSYRTKQNSYCLENLKHDIEKIESFQFATGAHNYFHYQIAINYLIKEGNKETVKDKLIKVKELLTLYIKRYEETIKQCQSESFYPIQLMFDECCIYIKDLDFSLFIPSSFSQPVNYRKLRENIEKYHIALYSIDNKIELAEEKKEILTLKDGIQGTTQRFIEIGGIFVAVLSLLFSVISFSSNTALTIKGLVIHSLGVGYIILIFVSGIYVLSLKKDMGWKYYLTRPRLWIFTIIALASFLALYLISTNNKLWDHL